MSADKSSKRPRLSTSEPTFNNDDFHSVRRPMTIEQLPDVTLLCIFSHLSSECLLDTISRVCRHWHSLHSDPSLYLRLTFQRHDPPTRVALHLIRTARWLRCLRMTERADADRLLQCVSANSGSRLETLVVRRCSGTRRRRSLAAESLRAVLEGCPRLAHLSLKGTQCNCREAYEEIGQRLSGLKSVDFGKARFFSTTALLNVATGCRRLQQLRAFAFYEKNTYPHLCDGTLTAFCHQGSLLTAVKINCAFCTDATIASLSTCRHLAKLNLYNARNVTDAGIAALALSPSLVRLTVWDAGQVSAPGWIHFLSGPLARRMKTLLLYYCGGVDDQVCEGLAGDLEEMHELKVLGSNVTERGYLALKQRVAARCKCVVSNGLGSWYHSNHWR